jgi:hypothetical protein
MRNVRLVLAVVIASACVPLAVLRDLFDYLSNKAFALVELVEPR